jgi:hypothetical protein
MITLSLLAANVKGPMIVIILSTNVASKEIDKEKSISIGGSGQGDH